MIVHRKSIVILTLVLLAILGTLALAADRTIDQTSVLSGQVVSEGLVTPGTVVSEGSVLVNVQTIAGPMPTARATSNGVVKEVLVKAGETIRSGDVVARIEPAHK